MPQDIFEKLRIEVRPSVQKNKGFQDPVSVEKQVAAGLYDLANEGRMREVANSFGIEKWTISKTIRRVLFYFRKIFTCIYLIKQHNYFADRKSYRTSLFIES